MTPVRELTQSEGSWALLKLWTVLIVPGCVSACCVGHWLNKYISKRELNATKPSVALQKRTAVVTETSLQGWNGCHSWRMDLPIHRELLNPPRWVSMGGDVPDCLCKSHCTHPADPLCLLHPTLFPWHQHCSARAGCGPATWPYGDRGEKWKSQWIQAQTYPWRGQAPQSEGTCRFGGGSKEHMLCCLLSGDTKISICYMLLGTATCILAAFLHASLNRSHLCAKATFEGDK